MKRVLASSAPQVIKKLRLSAQEFILAFCWFNSVASGLSSAFFEFQK